MADKAKAKDRFKPGDLVEINRPFPVGECVERKEYKVRGVEGDEHLYVEGSSRLYHSSYFRLVSPSADTSPIRTRREIVPGVYGYIGIENISGRSACVGVRGVEGEYGDRYLSPDELREAAHLFNQIAEVLEENAG